MLKMQTKVEALKKDNNQTVQTVMEHMCTCAVTSKSRPARLDQVEALFMSDKCVTSPHH